MSTHHFNHRTFMRGVGLSMALPWRESQTVWGDERPSSLPSREVPLRLCVTFSDNVFHIQSWRPTQDKPNIKHPLDGLPKDIGEHTGLMNDILVLGFQTDTTRISTLMLNNDHLDKMEVRPGRLVMPSDRWRSSNAR